LVSAAQKCLTMVLMLRLGKVGAARHKVSTARQSWCCQAQINDEKQIHATIDSKVVVVTEASIRGSLLLNDANGTACLTNEAIFQNLALMGVLTFETAKDAQATKILILKARLKKLEMKCKPNISHHRAWLKSVKRLSIKKRFGKKEFVSKQRRKKAKPRPTLDDSTLDDLDVDLAHDMDYMEIEEAVDEGRQSKKTKEINVTHDTEVLEKEGSNEEPVNAAGNTRISTAVPEVSTATPMTPPTTTSVFKNEDIFLADALVMLSDKTKLKGVAIKEVKESDRPARSILTLKRLPIIDPKDKGKGVLKESPVKKVKRSDLDAAQITKDAEIARLARIDADHELAVRWTQEEQEKYTVDERAKLLTEYFDNRKKQLAEERAAAIRKKPPTRTQLKSLMMTYLKHTSRYKHSQLKKKTLEEIQALYIK
ncbi:hypothetical protein Tco_1423623, partial [Tanacetum coccineum]